MSTSDKQLLYRISRRYLLAAAFCGVFSIIYEVFSHGVYSGFMIALFLFPLLGSAAPLLMARLGTGVPDPQTRSLWGFGWATLAVGSCLHGIFDIYGTTAPLTVVYWPVGIALLLAAAGSWAFRRRFA